VVLRTILVAAAILAAVCCDAAESGASRPPGPLSPAAELPRDGGSVHAAPDQQILRVDRAVLAGEGSMLQLHFTVPKPKNTEWLPVDQKETYVVDEANGEKFYVLKLVRLGPVGQVRLPKGGGPSYLVIDNREEHLKAGAKITVVIGTLKQEHVIVAKE